MPVAARTEPLPVRLDDATVISHRPPAPAMGAVAATIANPSELGRTLLGQKLDHFDLLEFVGGGGMGAVFKALDTRLNRIVALKVLARDHADEDEKVRRFQNEAQSAARLDHDHIARVYFVGQDCGMHYIVFEYIEGINLRDLVERKGPLSLDEAVSFTLQIAEALAHASSRDVVHRDIKPSNVLITPQGRAKLVDMGLARLHQVEHSQNDLTSSGVTLGTFDYISPEQARDPRCADVRSDIYSLGCTLYYVLTARPPFPEGNVLQKLLQHNNEPPPDPADYNPDLPEAVSKLMRKMLAKDPRRRHQKASELVADLLGLVDQLGLSTKGLESIAWTTPKPPRITWIERHAPWAAPLVLLVAIVLLLDWWSSRGDVAGPADVVPRQSTANTGRRPTSPLPPRVQPNDTGAETGSDDGQGAANSGEASERENPAARRDPAVASSPNAAGANGGELSAGAAVGEAPGSSQQSALDSLVAPRGGEGLAVEPIRGGISLAGDATTAVPAESRPTASGAAINTNNPPAEARPPREPAAPESAPRAGVLVVNPYGTASHEFATLRAACAKAKETGVDIVELQYNGRREEKPLRLDNLKLTIRAAEQYHPVLVFKPKDLLAVESQSMIAVIGGQLTLVNVAVEFEIPNRQEPEGWSLLELQRPDSLRLEKCSLTIRNANDQRTLHPNVAFIDLKAPPGSAAMAMDNSVVAEHAINIQLADCIARGEANFLRSDELQSANLTWVNGLLASSERLLSARGGDMATRRTGLVSLDLRHVTVAVRGGLCLLTNTESARPMLHTDIKCTDCIVLSGAEAALVEQVGVNTPAEFEEQVVWSGNHNYFSGFQTFWKIATLGSGQEPLRRDFSQWQDYWNEVGDNNVVWSQLLWKKLPDAGRPVHTHAAADYALDDRAPENRARGGAIDGLDAGFKSQDLPALPPSALPAEPAAPATTGLRPVRTE